MSKSRAIKFLESIDNTQFTVGMTVRAYRKRWGFTLEEVGKLTGISKSNLSAIENDKVDLGVKRAGLLAAALGVHPQRILFPNGKWEKSEEHKDIERKSKKLSAS